MSLKTRITVVAAGTALTAAMAVPALALENEFHGAFGLRATNSNYLGYGMNAGTGFLMDRRDSPGTTNYIDQRARIFYSAKANDNLKLVTGFELDATWGKSSYALDRNNGGGALGADTTNLETKWVYLDFNVPSTSINVKGGIQGLNDAYKGIIVGGGADAAGVLVSSPAGPATLTFGWFRLDDRNVTLANVVCQNNTTGAITTVAAGGTCPAGTTATTSVAASNAPNGTVAPGVTAAAFNAVEGKLTRDLLLLDAKYAITKDMKVGASYYFLNDDNAPSAASQTGAGSLGATFGPTLGQKSDYAVHILGMNAAAAFGPVAVDGFLVYEFGTIDTMNNAAAKTHVNAFAGNVAAKIKVGPGTAKVNALYVSGGTAASGGNLGNGFISVYNQNSGAFCENSLGGAMGNMFLLARNPGAGQSGNDQAIVYDSDNREMGIIGGSVGYDMTFDKLFTNVNAGFLATAKDQPGKQSQYQGTEINAEVGYKVYDSLTASVQAGYVMLGDFYKGTGTPTGTNPADPYVARMVLTYVF